MFQIELDVFSGRPNPRWNLSSKEQNELLDRVIANKSLISPVSMVESKLGYRGFIVIAPETDIERLQKLGIPPVFRVGANQNVDASWLLNTTHELQTNVYDYVRDELQTPASDGGLSEPQEPTISGTLPIDNGAGMSCASNYLTSSTNFDFWNADPSHRANNNCYNYASNRRTNTFAQPGRQVGQQYSAFSCSNVGTAVLADGWSNSCVASNNLSIYLVIWPNTDFHFYRLCTNGRWCHKPGTTNATNLDNAGNFITDPQTCAKGNYGNCSSGYYYAANGIVVN